MLLRERKGSLVWSWTAMEYRAILGEVEENGERQDPPDLQDQLVILVQ